MRVAVGILGFSLGGNSLSVHSETCSWSALAVEMVWHWSGWGSGSHFRPNSRSGFTGLP
jgi:hypothetical protein